MQAAQLRDEGHAREARALDAIGLAGAALTQGAQEDDPFSPLAHGHVQVGDRGTVLSAKMPGYDMLGAYAIDAHMADDMDMGGEARSPMSDYGPMVELVSKTLVEPYLGPSVAAFVANIPDIERIRYTTSHPVEFTDALIDAYATIPTLVNHLHLLKLQERMKP